MIVIIEGFKAVMNGVLGVNSPMLCKGSNNSFLKQFISTP